MTISLCELGYYLVNPFKIVKIYLTKILKTTLKTYVFGPATRNNYLLLFKKVVLTYSRSCNTYGKAKERS